jgi:predicted nucleotidyltransferase
LIKTLLNSNTLSEIEENILSTLTYFDLFSYPLNRGEIYLFLPVKCDMNNFNYALNSLVNEQHIYRFEKFYSLRNDHFLIERRTKGNKQAAELMVTARKVCSLLARFPYVRGIGISGSLSKNFADETADIDLFIITAKNRLWVARTFMHAFKKLTYLFNRQHYFCMNYYIDEQNLEIPEKNIYTATEVVTLIPLQGDVQFVDFFAANAWSRQFLPNNVMRVLRARPEPKTWLKAGIENMLNNKLGDWLDDRLWQITSNRWDKKTASKKRNIKGQVMAMETGKHFAKPDPDDFQNKLMNKYRLRVATVIKENHHSLAN